MLFADFERSRLARQLAIQQEDGDTTIRIQRSHRAAAAVGEALELKDSTGQEQTVLSEMRRTCASAHLLRKKIEEQIENKKIRKKREQKSQVIERRKESKKVQT